MYEKKTWINRQSEHPARRKLTPTGNDGTMFPAPRASSWKMAMPSMPTR